MGVAFCLYSVFLRSSPPIRRGFLKPRPGAACRAVVIVPTRRPRDLSKFAGAVDYVVVDDNVDAAHAERVGLRWIFNKYVGKSGALATALEELDADVYVFLDDDAEPGQWLEELKNAVGPTPLLIAGLEINFKTRFH